MGGVAEAIELLVEEVVKVQAGSDRLTSLRILDKSGR